MDIIRKDKMKKSKEYIYIALYGLILVMIFMGTNHLYGSTTDWVTQHSIIPEYFRTMFYETKSLVPNFAFNLGAGENIFNFCYYGFLSPIILVSYLLPFIEMRIYVMSASIILYIASGMLMYKFLKGHFSNKVSFFMALGFMSLSPISFQFHRHIMFVWYIPFLILAFMGVDKYVDQNKSLLLIFSIFLIIMTNYYYSVSSILSILFYGVYKLLKKQDKFNLKLFLGDILRASLRVLAGVFLAGIILLPAFYVILHTTKSLSISKITWPSLITPEFNEILYGSYSVGISALFVIALISDIINKKAKKEDCFLGISLLIISFIPIFMYMLNGALYIRGKALIPFTVIYTFALAKYVDNIKDINMKKVCIISLAILVVSLLAEYRFWYLLLIDLVIVFISFIFYKKSNNKNYILISLVATLFLSSFVNNFQEKYMTIKDYQKYNDKDMIKLINSIDDNDFYRTVNNVNASINANKVYNKNYYTTTMYSSNYNTLYWQFYNDDIANNIVYRNSVIIAGNNNLLFNNFMGVKYVISESNLGPGYELKKTEGKYGLYENKSAYPIVYLTNKYGSNKEYEKLDFPYNIEYMLNYGLTKEDVKADFNSKIQEYDLKNEESYNFNISKKKESFTYKLPEKIENKILIIKFDMNFSETCKNGDTIITINGQDNKLTCRSWLYHNKNYSFEYVLTNKEELEELNVKFTKGRYKISNIKAYIMDYDFNNYSSLENLAIDKRHSKISGNITTNSDAYIMSSIPFDEGFKAYVDGQAVDTEIVNKAFLGFKIPKGEREVMIKYSTPWLNYGYILSAVGIVLGSICFILDKKKLTNKKK